MDDLIYRRALLKSLYERALITDGNMMWKNGLWIRDTVIDEVVNAQPTAGPEPLTDTEKRIFLVAMGREEKVCRYTDMEWGNAGDPDEDTLVYVCNEIIRKVKGALWLTE